MGTAKFAVPSLYKLAEKENIIEVVTACDRPQGRGYKVLPCEVRLSAEKIGLNVTPVEKLKDEILIEHIKELAPDLIITIDFGKLIPVKILDIPKHGVICLHPSLLPKHRGPSP
ncbi:MAG: formyltransferase family protein, partial [Armatimonadota bacterium]